MLKEIAEGVYVETAYASGTLGLIHTARGAILVDTPMLPSDAREWQWTLRQNGVTNIYAIVNTDYHPEHLLGNAFFMPAKIIGHEASAKPISKYRTSLLDQLGSNYREENPGLAEEISQIQILSPELGVEDRMVIYSEDRQVEVLFLDGHTPASLGVYLPQEKILFAGDNIVKQEHPVMAQANSLAWLQTLERIKAMDIETIVPGNNGPCGKEVIDPLIDYIVEMRRRVTELYHSGASRRECVDKVGMLEFFPVPEDHATRIKRRRRENVERVYAEIRTCEPRGRH